MNFLGMYFFILSTTYICFTDAQDDSVGMVANGAPALMEQVQTPQVGTVLAQQPVVTGTQQLMQTGGVVSQQQQPAGIQTVPNIQPVIVPEMIQSGVSGVRQLTQSGVMVPQQPMSVQTVPMMQSGIAGMNPMMQNGVIMRQQPVYIPSGVNQQGYIQGMTPLVQSGGMIPQQPLNLQTGQLSGNNQSQGGILLQQQPQQPVFIPATAILGYYLNPAMLSNFGTSFMSGGMGMFRPLPYKRPMNAGPFIRQGRLNRPYFKPPFKPFKPPIMMSMGLEHMMDEFPIIEEF